MLNIVSITDLKQNLAKVVGQVKKSSQPVYILQRSKATAVIVDADHYMAMEKMIEDLSDIKAVKDRKGEKRVKATDIAKKLGI